MKMTSRTNDILIQLMKIVMACIKKAILRKMIMIKNETAYVQIEKK